jgi:hypothetical protein
MVEPFKKGWPAQVLEVWEPDPVTESNIPIQELIALAVSSPWILTPRQRLVLARSSEIDTRFIYVDFHPEDIGIVQIGSEYLNWSNPVSHLVLRCYAWVAKYQTGEKYSPAEIGEMRDVLRGIHGQGFGTSGARMHAAFSRLIRYASRYDLTSGICDELALDSVGRIWVPGSEYLYGFAEAETNTRFGAPISGSALTYNMENSRSEYIVE